MSAQEAGSTAQVAVVLTEERPSFLDNKIDLKTLHLALKRESKIALDAFVKILTNEKASDDMKFKAAKALLELQVAVAAEINKDQLQRLIAEAKLPPGRTALSKVSDEDDAPMVDFDNIREV